MDRLPEHNASKVVRAFLDEVAESELRLFRRRLNRVKRRTHCRKRRAWKSGWLLNRNKAGNPLIVRMATELKLCANEARRCALDHITEIVGRIAGDEDVLSSSSILFVVTEGKMLKKADVYHAVRSNKWELPIDALGLVPLVARTGLAKLIEDTVTTSEEYFPENPNTRCELAIPVLCDGIVIGVLNLESPRPGAFSWETLGRIKGRMAELIPHLLVLRSLDLSATQRCPWHPAIHGWDFQQVTQRLCRAFADELGPEATTCTIWYVDRDKQEVFAYGTCGCDWRFRDRQTLPLGNTTLGRHLASDHRTVAHYRPAETALFLDSQEARCLGIESGILGKVYRRSGDELPMSLVNVYLNRVEFPEVYGDRERLVEEALEELALLLPKLFEAYEAQRLHLALSMVDRELGHQKETGSTSQSLLEYFLSQMCDVFRVPAGSLFGLSAKGDALVCLASTGFRCGNLGNQYGINEADKVVEKFAITLTGAAKGHTVTAFRQDGKAVRRNRLHDAGERGLPQDCPLQGGSSVPEFIAGEKFVFGKLSNRRFLACAVTKDNQTVGVLRFVRSEGSFPFTKCDERLIEAVCRRIGTPSSDQHSVEVAHQSIGELVVAGVVERRARNGEKQGENHLAPNITV